MDDQTVALFEELLATTKPYKHGKCEAFASKLNSEKVTQLISYSESLIHESEEKKKDWNKWRRVLIAICRHVIEYLCVSTNNKAYIEMFSKSIESYTICMASERLSRRQVFQICVGHKRGRAIDLFNYHEALISQCFH